MRSPRYMYNFFEKTPKRLLVELKRHSIPYVYQIIRNDLAIFIPDRLTRRLQPIRPTKSHPLLDMSVILPDNLPQHMLTVTPGRQARHVTSEAQHLGPLEPLGLHQDP